MPFVTFSHPISRTYSYPWFKWTVLLGGICAIIFVTALNLAADGYVLKLQLTQDYNGTVYQRRWTNHFPFNLLEQATTICQSVEIPVNSHFWTDKLSLPFTLTRAWQNQNGTIVDIPAVNYTNNRLENCSLSYIKIDLSPLDIAGTQLIAPWSEDVPSAGTGDLTWSPKATAHVNCTINNGIYPMFLGLAAEYSSLSPSGVMKNFPREPTEKQASFWWGKSLLSWYWSDLASSSGNGYTTGSMDLLPRDGTRNGSIDITRPDFFWVSGYWFRKTPGEQAATWFARDPVSFPDQTPCKGCPDIGSQINYFAKSMYAMVLADLGQHSEQFQESNVLLQPHLLEYLSANISVLKPQLNEAWWFPGGPATEPYNASSAAPTAASLNITDSYIYTQYLCQIPTLKPTGPLLMSVIIADLVLLQTLWKLLNWGTTAWLERRDPQANYCEGHYNIIRLLQLEETEGDNDNKNNFNEDLMLRSPSRSPTLRDGEGHYHVSPSPKEAAPASRSRTRYRRL